MRRLDRFQIDLTQSRPGQSIAVICFGQAQSKKIETEDVYRQNDGNACYKWINQTVHTIGNQLPNTSFKVYQRRKKTANREKNGHPEYVDEITQYIKNRRLAMRITEKSCLIKDIGAVQHRCVNDNPEQYHNGTDGIKSVYPVFDGFQIAGVNCPLARKDSVFTISNLRRARLRNSFAVCS